MLTKDIARILGAVIFSVSIPIANAQDMASPPNSLVVADTGDVGVGTDTPQDAIHSFRTSGLNLVRIEMEGNAATSNQGGFAFINGGPAGPGQHRWDMRPGGVANLIFNYNSGPTEFIYTTTGNLLLAGSVNPGSSRTLKEDFQTVDANDILGKVLGLEISNWKYKRDLPRTRHIGPVAEDFQAAFGLGDGKTISYTDGQGIAFAAIQGLKADSDKQLMALREELDRKDTEIKGLRADLTELRNMIQTLAGRAQIASTE